MGRVYLQPTASTAIAPRFSAHFAHRTWKLGWVVGKIVTLMIVGKIVTLMIEQGVTLLRERKAEEADHPLHIPPPPPPPPSPA